MHARIGLTGFRVAAFGCFVTATLSLVDLGCSGPPPAPAPAEQPRRSVASTVLPGFAGRIIAYSRAKMRLYQLQAQGAGGDLQLSEFPIDADCPQIAGLNLSPNRRYLLVRCNSGRVRSRLLDLTGNTSRPFDVSSGVWDADSQHLFRVVDGMLGRTSMDGKTRNLYEGDWAPYLETNVMGTAKRPTRIRGGLSEAVRVGPRTLLFQRHTGCFPSELRSGYEERDCTTADNTTTLYDETRPRPLGDVSGRWYVRSVGPQGHVILSKGEVNGPQFLSGPITEWDENRFLPLADLPGWHPEYFNISIPPEFTHREGSLPPVFCPQTARLFYFTNFDDAATAGRVRFMDLNTGATTDGPSIRAYHRAAGDAVIDPTERWIATAVRVVRAQMIAFSILDLQTGQEHAIYYNGQGIPGMRDLLDGGVRLVAWLEK